MTHKIPACAVFLLALCLCAACAAEAEPDEELTIRIGISEYPHYAYYDENGYPAGVQTEYAYTIGQYADLTVQVVPIRNAEDAFAALDKARVDVLFDMFKTEEREKNYLFTELPTGNTQTFIYVRQNDTRFAYGDENKIGDILLGYEKDSYVVSIFRQWCAEKGYEPRLREFRGTKEINAALDAGEIDAGLFSAEFPMAGYRSILKISPRNYYCMFRKEDVRLKKRFDKALSGLLAEESLVKDKLLQKYRAAHQGTAISWTKDEKAYLAEHPLLKVAVLENDEPYFSLDANGSPRGVLPDYYAGISSLCDTKFSFLACKTQKDALDAVTSGKADILGLFSGGILAAHNEGFRLSSPYTSVSTVLVTPAGSNSGAIRSIAVKRRYLNLVQLGLGKDFGAKPVPFNNAQECFEALREKKVDAMACGFPSVTWLINQTYSSAWTVSPLYGINLDLCAATLYGNGMLCTILNKAINAFPFIFNGYVTKNTITGNDLLTEIAQISPARMAVAISFLLLLVLCLVVTLIIIRRRQRERVALLKTKAAVEREKSRLEAIEKSGEERNSFFSTISHDMRTPLNAILGFSDLASKEENRERLNDQLRKIRLSGDLLLDLINDTLTISKINSGKLSLNLAPTDLHGLAGAVAVPVRAMAEGKDIRFVLNNFWPKRKVLADSLNLKKILLNLLTNAVKYTPSGGHVSMMLTCRALSSGLECQARIGDDGIGISPKFLPHIYEPFTQENRMPGAFGTGLGLSISKRFVDMMGGKIEVQSEEGKGTDFTLRFYFDLAADAPVEDSTAKTADPSGLKGHKVLLCEDNALNTEIATALLRTMGLEVTTATNGKQGVERFAMSPPGTYAAILMDIRMPVMDGIEATRTIRELDRPDAKTIPIIAMTADVLEDDVRRVLACGVNAHIAKPINVGDLQTTLVRFVCA